jgi:hypothetical protein
MIYKAIELLKKNNVTKEQAGLHPGNRRFDCDEKKYLLLGVLNGRKWWIVLH